MAGLCIGVDAVECTALATYTRYNTQRQQQQLWRQLQCFDSAGNGFVRDARAHVLCNMASNDYLGLSQHAALRQGAVAAVEKYGVGTPSSRLVCGHSGWLAHIEAQLASFLGYEQVLIFASGYQMCAGVVAALADALVWGRNCVACLDKTAHASLYAGLAQAGAVLQRYAHQSSTGLQRALPTADLWLSEGVFSMDGDCITNTDLWHNAALRAAQYGVLSVMDDAHGFAVLGAQGQGSFANAAIKPQVLLGTFSKGLGCSGGFVACSSTVANYLLQKCGAFIYTTAMAPPVLGAVAAGLALLPQLDEQRARLQQYAQQLRHALQDAGFNTGCSNTHIVTWLLPTLEQAQRAYAYLYAAGFLTGLIRPPTVPTPRLRICPTAAHTPQQIAALQQVIAGFAL